MGLRIGALDINGNSRDALMMMMMMMMITIKGSLYWSIPMLKRFFAAKNLHSIWVPKFSIFRKYQGLNVKHSHRDPKKGMSVRGTTSFDVFCVKIRSRV